MTLLCDEFEAGTDSEVGAGSEAGTETGTGIGMGTGTEVETMFGGATISGPEMRFWVGSVAQPTLPDMVSQDRSSFKKSKGPACSVFVYEFAIASSSCCKGTRAGEGSREPRKNRRGRNATGYG